MVGHINFKSGKPQMALNESPGCIKRSEQPDLTLGRCKSHLSGSNLKHHRKTLRAASNGRMDRPASMNQPSQYGFLDCGGLIHFF